MKAIISLPKNNKGAAIIELAFVLPFLLLIALATFDYSRAIHSKNIITNMSREAANLAARSPITSSNQQNILDAVTLTAQPLTMNSNGMIIVSEIKGTDNSGTIEPIIQERYIWHKSLSPVPSSKIGSKGGRASNLGEVSNDNTLTDGQYVYAAEVFYTYSPLFSIFSGTDKQLYAITVFSQN